MEYKLLGKTGLKVSQLCFGTMSFGGDADKAASKAMFDRCRDAGINFFDCANLYQKGLAEKILGDLISDCRKEVVITSKVYFGIDNHVNAKGASRRNIILAVEESLKRLKTDYIDIYFIHRYDEDTDLSETLRALEDLVRQGKILYSGASNFAAWQISKALGISLKNNWSEFICIQPMYNLVKRQAEVEILPMALAENLAVIPYSPLGGGLLTGKYGVNRKPESGRLIDNDRYQIRYGEADYYETAQKFNDFATKNGYDPASLAVAWIAGHPAVTAPIIGARNLKQLEGSLKSIEIEMSNELRDEISKLSPAPSPATDRNEELVSSNF
jgi:aryl-alcohol dehydrogenase-like predicted oxidoreductase